MGRVFDYVGILSIGIYRSLTLIGIGLGVFLATRGINGHGLGSLFTAIVGIFVVVKEVLDIFNYASVLNFIGVGLGLLLAFLGFSGHSLSSAALAVAGSFIILKEVIDLLHSGH